MLWQLAKMHALSADSQRHEMLSHLGISHLAMEPFAIAHHNTYIYEPGFFDSAPTGQKALGELLRPHFKHLIAINNIGRDTLIA